MKKLALLTLLFFIINQKTIAQFSFPTYTDNPVWHVGTLSFFSNVCIIDLIKIGPPTNICSISYNPVLRCDYDGGNCKTIGYYRVQGSKVFVRQKFAVGCVDTDKLMYDFNMQIGDTVRCLYNVVDTNRFWKTNQFNDMYENVSRITSVMNYYLYITGGAKLQMKWIEGIGSVTHPFYPFINIGGSSEEETQLIKAISNGKTNYLDTALTFQYLCNSWVGIKNYGETELPKVYPKITSDNIYIDNKTEKGQYKLINLFGQVIESGEFFEGLNTFNIERFPNGIYFISLTRDGKLIYKSKILKQEN